MMPVVVKLGGSTAGQHEMQGWIDVLVTAQFPVIIVPGGGPFADQVRFSQKQLRFSDDAAHDMAILAMDQFGIVIAERNSRLMITRSVADIETATSRGLTPVWLPSALTIGAADIPRSWDMTSDSLAAWLCAHIGADTLLLIKQADTPDGAIHLKDLVEIGMVDAMLPEMLGETTLYIAGPLTLRTVRPDKRLASIPGALVKRARVEEGALSE